MTHPLHDLGTDIKKRGKQPIHHDGYNQGGHNFHNLHDHRHHG